jgi:hypothetical protein
VTWSEPAAIFSGIIVLSFGLTLLLSGLFTSYFGAGKSRKIGVGLSLLGLLILFGWITVTFDVQVFTTVDAWNASQMANGIVAVIAGAIGGLLAMGIFLFAIMRA